ncbi:hypothetical protein BT63DRAFT_477646 [Microthyrium microscopicum]|uniref:Altered inheritance of mitochondria protein 24, mitochondrial n=1 Tax=Microthyrium microscopicum TaxID=703497 RepID=A0A6A6UHD2_9PEZI|nr:hypothetical protein BT63DRAFT_477646 [Microthyrium microscopicum]
MTARNSLHAWTFGSSAFKPVTTRVSAQSLLKFKRLQSTASVIQLPKEDGSQVPGVASRTADASFEVLGTPFSLLSVKLSPSQILYTRRGTLVALNGSPENAISTLSIFSPLRRAAVGIPFLYQKISSTSPLTAIIGTNKTASSFTTVHLDGRTDWIVAQRNGLVSWTGHNLIVKPKLNFSMSIAHWSNTHITGRGLIGLIGNGQVYQINLAANEDYVVHPKHVLAYSLNETAPQAYRFKSNVFRFQIPSLSSLLPDTRFIREIRKTPAWQFLAEALYTIRTWARRSIWGDRLFLRFRGPTTILVQSRASKIVDSLTSGDVNDIANSPAGAPFLKQSTTTPSEQPSQTPVTSPKDFKASPPPEKPTTMHFATVSSSGKVEIK